jgi:hypothetical protein
VVIRDVDAHSDRAAFATTNESLESHTTTFALNSLAVSAGIPSGEVADVQALDQDLHGAAVVNIVRLANELQFDVLDPYGLRTTASSNAHERVLSEGLTRDLDARPAAPRGEDLSSDRAEAVRRAPPPPQPGSRGVQIAGP